MLYITGCNKHEKSTLTSKSISESALRSRASPSSSFGTSSLPSVKDALSAPAVGLWNSMPSGVADLKDRADDLLDPFDPFELACDLTDGVHTEPPLCDCLDGGKLVGDCNTSGDVIDGVTDPPSSRHKVGGVGVGEMWACSVNCWNNGVGSSITLWQASWNVASSNNPLQKTH